VTAKKEFIQRVGHGALPMRQGGCCGRSDL